MKVWWGKFERLGGDPKAVVELMRMNSQIDITKILPTVQAPTLVIHRNKDVLVDYEGGRHLAAGIPNARLLTLSGPDHLPFIGDDSKRITDEMEEFLTGARSAPTGDRVLATVMFTDIVDSTQTAHAMGDEKWRDVLEAHNAELRRQLARYRGTKIKVLGDGFLATFDGPARAIKCALEILRATQRLGVKVRIGLHTGEVRMVNKDVEGIAVHIASRVAAAASGGELLISRTVKGLIAGSGISLEDSGFHTLKGVPEEWQLFRAVA